MTYHRKILLRRISVLKTNDLTKFQQSRGCSGSLRFCVIDISNRRSSNTLLVGDVADDSLCEVPVCLASTEAGVRVNQNLQQAQLALNKLALKVERGPDETK